MNDRVKVIAAEIAEIAKQIAMLHGKRIVLQEESCALRTGFCIGDKMRHKRTEKIGYVIGYDGPYWPVLEMCKANGERGVRRERTYHIEDWEKV